MKKILIIDNDPDTMRLLKSLLEKKSYVVMVTENKHDIPVLIEQFDPGLVIVDVMKNDVVAEIKSYEESRNVPVLLMTGYTHTLKDRQLPVDDTIEKPFELPLLERKIERLIHAFRA